MRTGTFPAPLGQLHRVLNAAPDPMVVVDRKGRIAALNAAAKRFFGWAEAEVLGEPMERFVPGFVPGDAGSNGTNGASFVAPPIRCSALRKNGSESSVELTQGRLGPEQDAPLMLTLRDLTQLQQTGSACSPHTSWGRHALHSIADAVIATDNGGRVTYLNPAAERLTSWAAGVAVGKPLGLVLPLISEATRRPIADPVRRSLDGNGPVDPDDGVVLLARDGREVPVGHSAALIRIGANAAVGVVLVVRDDSVQRQVGNQLSFEAKHDALTGLVNRREFERRLTRVATGPPGASSPSSLLYMDLDNFKVINDSCGHDAGDALLRHLGPRLTRHLRQRDTLARLGGDEFGFLLEHCPLAEASRIAERLREEVDQHPFEWAGRSFPIGASIGVIEVTAGNDGIAGVMRAADAACYAAKAGGGNRIDFGATDNGSARQFAHGP